MKRQEQLNPTPLKVLGRSHYACSRCKNSKIKCSGDKPACSNCVNSRKADECVYPNKDRKVIILESQLTSLQERITSLESMLKQQDSAQFAEYQKTPKIVTEAYDYEDPPQYYKYDDKAVSSDKRLINSEKVGNLSCQVFDDELQSFLMDVSKTPASSGINLASHEKYLFNDSDNEIIDKNLFSKHKLPTKEYALQLINKVHELYGNEYYIIDQDFYKTVDSIYQSETSANVSSLTLAYFFSLLAFGEQLLVIVANEGLRIPGIDHFLSAIHLTRINHEELNLQSIQTYLVLGLYSLNLNRATTAFNYFGIAVRSSVARGLHRSSSNLKQYLPEADYQDAEKFKIFKEKAKRVWWTVFVLDSAWCSKMSMPVHIQICDTDIDYPMENPVDLGDGFDLRMLHENCNLSKFISKIIKRIYCPQNRTYYFTRSDNSIASLKNSEKLFIQSTLECLTDMTDFFEKLLPEDYLDKKNLIQSDNRKLANLYLRYNQVVLLIIRPLLLAIFKKDLKENDETRKATSTGIFAACCNVDIVYNLNKNGLLFEMGFWDPQYIFTSLLILIIASLTGRKYPQINRGIKLLKIMSDRGNINATNNYERVKELDGILRTMSGSKVTLGLVQIESEISSGDKGGIDMLKRESIDSDDSSAPALKKFKQENTSPNMLTSIHYSPDHSTQLQPGQVYDSAASSSSSGGTPPEALQPQYQLPAHVQNSAPQPQFVPPPHYHYQQHYPLQHAAPANSHSSNPVPMAANQIPRPVMQEQLQMLPQGETQDDIWKKSFLSQVAWNQAYNSENFIPQPNLNIPPQQLNTLIDNMQNWDYLGTPMADSGGYISFNDGDELQKMFSGPM